MTERGPEILGPLDGPLEYLQKLSKGRLNLEVEEAMPELTERSSHRGLLILQNQIVNFRLIEEVF